MQSQGELSPVVIDSPLHRQQSTLSVLSSLKPEQSPLSQQSRPQTFEPKILGLYRQILKAADEDELTDGFWHELFLLQPNLAKFETILFETDVRTLIQAQRHTQQLVSRATLAIGSGSRPADNALDTLTVFFATTLRKKYTNPSSDIIEVLAGLNHIDHVLNDLVGVLEGVISADDGQSTTQQKAVKTILSIVSGGYHTALVTYFVQRDLFAALTKLIHRLENPLHIAEPFLLLGVLANHNKFESPNQYRTRFMNSNDDEFHTKMIECIAWCCTVLRERYITILDDQPGSWSIGGTLTYVGLGALTGAKQTAPILTEDQQKELFTEQPDEQAAMLITIYEFILVNKSFAQQFLSLASVDQGQPPPFSLFLSFASYLFQHAFRSSRAASYAYITLVTLTILTEDSTTARLVCESSAPVRLCRQRPPHLPSVTTDRTYAASLLDILTNAINGNLRKRLDTTFYKQIIATLEGLLRHMSRSRTRIEYHWSELWRSLLSFVRFLTAYASDLESLAGISHVVNGTSRLLAYALNSGEIFLAGPQAYDDLFYKLLESGESLRKLRDTYVKPHADQDASVETLISVVQHYQELIDSHKAKKDHLSPREVVKIIKQGYETLPLGSSDTPITENTPKYREMEHKTELKKALRVVVSDATTLSLRR